MPDGWASNIFLERELGGLPKDSKKWRLGASVSLTDPRHSEPVIAATTSLEKTDLNRFWRNKLEANIILPEKHISAGFGLETKRNLNSKNYSGNLNLNLKNPDPKAFWNPIATLSKSWKYEKDKGKPKSPLKLSLEDSQNPANSEGVSGNATFTFLNSIHPSSASATVRNTTSQGNNGLETAVKLNTNAKFNITSINAYANATQSDPEGYSDTLSTKVYFNTGTNTLGYTVTGSQKPSDTNDALSDAMLDFAGFPKVGFSINADTNAPSPKFEIKNKDTD